MKLDEIDKLDDLVRKELPEEMKKKGITVKYIKNGEIMSITQNTTYDDVSVDNVIEIEVEQFKFNKSEEIQMEIEQQFLKENENSKEIKFSDFIEETNEKSYLLNLSTCYLNFETKICQNKVWVVKYIIMKKDCLIILKDKEK